MIADVLPMAKKTTPFLNFILSTNPNHIPSPPPTIPKDRISPIIIICASSLTSILPLLPREKTDDGNQIPSIIFHARPHIYYGFVVSVMFAFSFAFSSMFLYTRPQAARAFRFCAMICSCSALALFVFAVYCNHLSQLSW